MANHERKSKLKDCLILATVFLLFAFTLVLEAISVTLLSDPFQNDMLMKIVQRAAGSIATFLLLLTFNVKVFSKPRKPLYFALCLLIAVNNFQFFSWLCGKMELSRTAPMDIWLFLGYCLSVGLFEELIFRGLLFPALLGVFPKDKKGFWLAYVLSAVLFGAVHLFNGINGAALLQVGYGTLIGGLLLLCLIKTGNVLCCVGVHTVYNFCGLLYSKQGLGLGIVWDLGTVLTMGGVALAVGIFVVYKLITYTKEEREELYIRLGVRAAEGGEE